MRRILSQSRAATRLTRFLSSAAVDAVRAPPPSADTKAGQFLVTGMMDVLKPKDVVDQLDKFIVGQTEAKRQVANAMRNRWRRQQLPESMRNEVIPKNILMIGPTGCGKTEIARRIAKMSQSPFIKVEATKFTEVGFHGKDVDQIIRDLLDVAISLTTKRIREEIRTNVASIVEERILELLVGSYADPRQRESYRELLREGKLESRTIDVDIPQKSPKDSTPHIFIDSAGQTGNLSSELFRAFTKSAQNAAAKKDRRSMPLKDARPIIEEHEIDKLLEDYDIPKLAIASVEESGIVFIDEIDKLISGDGGRSADASSEGVQRDLLPLIEGSAISTKHGNVNTDYVLFIAAGAFHSNKPSDLLAELQGRLPVRVTLKGLSEEDLYRILTEPVANLIVQQVEMMKTENVDLVFTDDAIREIAHMAHLTNKTVDNIGARRLHTVIERVMEEISFEAPQKNGERFVVDADYVRTRVKGLLGNADLRRYIL